MLAFTGVASSSAPPLCCKRAPDINICKWSLWNAGEVMTICRSLGDQMSSTCLGDLVCGRETLSKDASGTSCMDPAFLSSAPLTLSKGPQWWGEDLATKNITVFVKFPIFPPNRQLSLSSYTVMNPERLNNCKKDITLSSNSSIVFSFVENLHPVLAGMNRRPWFVWRHPVKMAEHKCFKAVRAAYVCCLPGAALHMLAVFRVGCTDIPVSPL